MPKQISITKKTLQNLYFEKGLSMAKIAKKFNCYPSTIQRAMCRYGIKSRSLSEAAEKVSISKKTLYELYYRNNLSTEEIAQKYHCNHVSILNKMKKYGLKRRSKLGTRKPITISEEKLKKLYIDKKFSQTQIAKKIKCSRSGIDKLMREKYKIKRRTISEAGMKYQKFDFSGNPVEKAYLIGFRLGDLRVMRARLQIYVDCSSTKLVQLKLFKKLFNKYTKVNIRQNRSIKNKPVTDMQCLLNNSFTFLLPKKDKIDSWILKSKKPFFAFAAGYIDAEGHISVRISNKNSKTPVSGFQLGSYDKGVLLEMWRQFNKFGIFCQKPKINKKKGYCSKDGLINRRDLWRLNVNRKKNLYLLLKQIEPFIKHGKRKKDLLAAKKNLESRLKNSN